MKQIQLLKVVNVLLFTCFLFVVISLIFYKLIPGSLNGSEIMAEMHETSGIVFVILVFIHFSLNFKWVKMNYFTKKKK